MFGYLTINEEAVSRTEAARYRAAYCGVCRALHERFGQRERLALNHDMTFLALVLSSLYEPAEQAGSMACPLHPVAKRPYAANRFTDYAADMTIALMYFKCLDDVADDGSARARRFARVLEPDYRDVRQRWPRQCAALEAGLYDVARIEGRARRAAGLGDAARAMAPGPDEAACAFGGAMAELFCPDEGDFWAEGLRVLGFELGRFAYLMDAACDLPEDEETGSYNPFARSGLEPAQLRVVLEGVMARAARAFERLPLVQDAHLLESCVYSGAWARFNRAYGTEGGTDGNDDEEGGRVGALRTWKPEAAIA